MVVSVADAKVLLGRLADKQLWPAGSAGKLQLQLIDTASNTGAVKPLATATVDLDMRRWKDSQTYQAEVPLVADGVLSATVHNVTQQLVHAPSEHTIIDGLLAVALASLLLVPEYHTLDPYISMQQFTHTLCCNQDDTSVPLSLAWLI